MSRIYCELSDVKRLLRSVINRESKIRFSEAYRGLKTDPGNSGNISLNGGGRLPIYLPKPLAYAIQRKVFELEAKEDEEVKPDFLRVLYVIIWLYSQKEGLLKPFMNCKHKRFTISKDESYGFCLDCGVRLLNIHWSDAQGWVWSKVDPFFEREYYRVILGVEPPKPKSDVKTVEELKKEGLLDEV